MTNREWLAGLTDDELAEWLDFHVDACCICSHKLENGGCDIPDEGYDCLNGRKKWLGQKHKTPRNRTYKDKCVMCGAEVTVYVSAFNGHKSYHCDKCGGTLME